MAIFIDESTRFLIQGITGKQGRQATVEMLKLGSKVLAGVTPGKGGQDVEGIPVFNSIAEAQEQVGQIDATVLYVPARVAKAAIEEALVAGIKLLVIITENIPLHDMAYCIALARKQGARIIGASSVGIYSLGKAKCGSIAGGKSEVSFTPGSIGVISRSGGMSSETSLVLTKAGFGQSTVLSTGSDVLIGQSFVDLIRDFEADDQTHAIVLFGEIGGTAEEDLASYLVDRQEMGKAFSKPIVAYVSGVFGSQFHNVSLGHAGAIIEGEQGTRDHKVAALQAAGVTVVEYHHEIPAALRELLGEDDTKSASESETQVHEEANQEEAEIEEQPVNDSDSLEEDASSEQEDSEPVELEDPLTSEIKETSTKNDLAEPVLDSGLRFQTGLSKISKEKGPHIHGEAVVDLLDELSFSDTIFYLLKGKKPEAIEAKIFSAFLTLLVDHGMGTTSSVSTRFIASGGNPLNAAVAGGILSIGDFHGGAIERSMKQLLAADALVEQEGLDVLLKNITAGIEQKKVFFGFGHKFYKQRDPRVLRMRELFKELSFESRYLRYVDLIENQFKEVKGKNIPVNIDGLFAAVLCEFGFDPLLAKGLFIIGRTAGLVGQAYEELKYEKPVRRVNESAIEWAAERTPRN